MKKEKWINSENYKDYLQHMALYAFNNRLQNYGYDYKTFRNMSNHKSKLNKLVQKMSNNLSQEYYGIYSRFYFPENSNEIHYCTGQSQNEEMITVLECLTGTYKN